jgi:hypothetical protein
LSILRQPRFSWERPCTPMPGWKVRKGKIWNIKHQLKHILE